MNRKIIFLLVVLTLVVFLPEVSVAQCAMCKATVTNNAKTGASKIGAGLNGGILYLMSFPYLIFAIIGYFWYRNSRKNGKRAKASGHFKGEVPPLQTR